MSSGDYYYNGCEEENYQPHFLDCCFLCQRQINLNCDIFMYRGNTPFCSQECRQEQIEMDEANERRRWKVSSKSSSKRSASKSKDQSVQESDTNKAVRTGTVAVA